MRRIVWTLVRGAAPAILVATLIPMALFYVALNLGDIFTAIFISVAYAYTVAAYQYFRRRRVSGMLLLTAFMATVKAVAALASGHAFLYFAIPIAETAGFGLMFVATMFSSEPLVVRLARDLVPHAAEGIAAQRMLMRRLSLVWTITYLGSGATTFLLLTSVSTPVYMGAHTLTGWFWSGMGMAISLITCQRRSRGLISQVLKPAAGIATPAIAAA